MTAAGGAGASAFLQSFVDSGARGSKGGDQSAEQPGEHSQSEREGHHLPVKTDGTDAGKRFRQEADADAQRDPCQSQAQQSAATC